MVGKEGVIVRSRIAFGQAARFFGVISLLILGILVSTYLPADAAIISEFSVTTANGGPWGITSGPDGNLWFAEFNGNMIGRITPDGVVDEFSAGISPGYWPGSITLGPDGNLWFTEEYYGNNIGCITPAGVITEFPHIPTVDSYPTGITAGPDGNVWFTEYHGNKIGRITPAGEIMEFPLPIADSYPYGITAGSDGNLWFTEYNGNKIGKVSVSETGGSSLTIRRIHAGSPPHTYSTVHDAYTAAATGDIIQLQAVDLTEPLTFADSIDVTLRGGYDSAFVLNPGMTTVKSMTISGGKVTVEKLVIK
jgi:streptogramin lyase